MNTHDLEPYSPKDLLELIAAANDRLEQIKQQHIEAAAALGLSLVQGDGKKRKRRSNAQHKEAD